jgi:excisionase family DNA binding protein
MAEVSALGRTALPRLLTVKELAGVLRISERTAYRLLETEIPAVRVGPRRIRVRVDDVEAFLDGQRERPGP